MRVVQVHDQRTQRQPLLAAGDRNFQKNGRRATALVMAASLFILKLGLAVGGAFVVWMLGAYGFEANQEQSAATLQGIRLLMSVFPSIFGVVAVVLMSFYPLSEKVPGQVEQELAARRGAGSEAMTRNLTLTALLLAGSLAPMPALAEEPGLKDAAPPGMLIGVALGRTQTTGQDPHVEALVPRNFDSLTPENEVKWERVHPHRRRSARCRWRPGPRSPASPRRRSPCGPRAPSPGCSSWPSPGIRDGRPASTMSRPDASRPTRGCERCLYPRGHTRSS